MNQGFDRDRLIELAGRLCDEQITPNEVAELEADLQANRDARKLFHLTVSLHRDLQLCEIASGHSPDAVGSTETEPPIASRRASGTSPSARRSTPNLLKVLIGLFLFAMVTTASLFFRGRPSSSDGIVGVTITDLIDVTWADHQPALSVGDNVGSQRLRLTTGLARLTYSQGVVMTIEGPAEVDLVSSERAVLHRGQLLAYVPEGVEGFRVSTPIADVVDLGTEFGVTASDDGSSNVIVFDGEVELSTAEDSLAEPQRVSAGLAWQVDRDGTTKQTEFQQAEFETPRSVLRGRNVIRETFRSADLFPGKSERGWTSPWSISARRLVVNDGSASIQSDPQLFPGTQHHLTVSAASDSEMETSTLTLSRSFASFGGFDATAPYTIEFFFRLESDPRTIRRIRIAAGEPSQRNRGAEMWHIRTGRSSDELDALQWQVYHPDRGEPFDVLPIVQGRSHRFLIEVDPTIGRWRTTISDGQRTVWNTLRNGDPLRLSGDDEVDGAVLKWQLDGAPGVDVSFSLDAIRIQNRPAAGTLAAR